jgi:hypothetical protein
MQDQEVYRSSEIAELCGVCAEHAHDTYHRCAKCEEHFSTTMMEVVVQRHNRVKPVLQLVFLAAALAGWLIGVHALPSDAPVGTGFIGWLIMLTVLVVGTLAIEWGFRRKRRLLRFQFLSERP